MWIARSPTAAASATSPRHRARWRRSDRPGRPCSSSSRRWCWCRSGMSAYAPAVGIAVLVVVVACAGLVVAARSERARPRRDRARTDDPPHRARDASARSSRCSRHPLVVVGGHVATFVVACLAVGVDRPAEQADRRGADRRARGSIPLNIGGWGPREGAAAVGVRGRRASARRRASRPRPPSAFWR